MGGGGPWMTYIQKPSTYRIAQMADPVKRRGRTSDVCARSEICGAMLVKVLVPLYGHRLITVKHPKRKKKGGGVRRMWVNALSSSLETSESVSVPPGPSPSPNWDPHRDHYET